jgi:hypothetical protein
MRVPTNDPRNATRLLAERVDLLSGVVSALMSQVAHITGEGFTERDFRLVEASAQKMAPEPIGSAPASAPKLHAAQTVQLLWSMVQDLRASRSA